MLKKLNPSRTWFRAIFLYLFVFLVLSFRTGTNELEAAMGKNGGMSQSDSWSDDGGGGGGGGGDDANNGDFNSPYYLDPSKNHTGRLVDTDRPELGGGLVSYDDGSNPGGLGSPIDFTAIDDDADVQDPGMPAQRYERGDPVTLIPPGQEVQPGYGVPPVPPSGIGIGIMSYTEPESGGPIGAGAPVRSATSLVPDPGIFDPMAGTDGQLGFPPTNHSNSTGDGGSSGGGGGNNNF